MDTITAHTNYIVLAPTHPTHKGLLKKISLAMAEIEDIREAHLPNVIEFGPNNTPELTLFAVVNGDCNRDQLKELLHSKINSGFFNKNAVAIKIIPEDFPLLESIRDTNCLIGWRD